MNKIDIKNLLEDELEGKLKELDEPPYRAAQIFRWLYKAGVRSFDEMTDIPDALRRVLKARFHISHPVMLDSKRSTLDGTTKYLLKMEDASTIETVFLPEARRTTICLSSQVGCKYACHFCASAPFGFIRNLTASEIVGQVLFAKFANPSSRITNLVFMGIGEGLDNYDNVLRSIRIFNDGDAFNIGARRITISTCGIIPGITRLADEGLQVELSVSLHSADDSVRTRLVPVNKKYPLADLMAACKDYIDRTKRIITFEYVLIRDINSSEKDALRLARLLGPIKCKVNVISYNRIMAKDYMPPSDKAVGAFINILRDGGINVTHRKSKGEEIEAGCGQLRISRL